MHPGVPLGLPDLQASTVVRTGGNSFPNLRPEGLTTQLRDSVNSNYGTGFGGKYVIITLGTGTLKDTPRAS